MMKKLFDTSFKEIFFAQIFAVIGGLIGGTILAIYTDKLLIIPGMLILLPGFLEMRGNISGSFASRLSSGLFLRIINPNRKNNRIIDGNLIAAFTLVMIISTVLGIIAFLFNYFILGVFIPQIIFLSLSAGIIANFIEIPLTMFTTFYLFRKGHDPNNIIGTVITTTGDVTSIIALLIALFIVKI